LLGGGEAVPLVWWMAVGLAGAVLLAGSGYCLVKGRALRKAHPFAGGGLNRAFLVVCVLEGVGVGVVIQAAQRLGRMDLLPAGIGMVIGLHFFGLARAFSMPAYYATGVAITLWCVMACVLFRGDALAVGVGVGTGGILWATVAFHLARVLRVRLAP
jgi:hypothetical protein